MATSSLVTLKDIADELKINYKTLLSCKHRFNDYIMAASVGRTARYEKDWQDFFRLVFALLDEGYQTDEIKQLLDNGITEEKDMFIKEWLDEWRGKIFIGPQLGYSQNSRLTDLLPDGLTDAPTDLPTDAPADGLTELLTDGPTDGLSGSPTDVLTGGLPDLPTGGLVDLPTGCLTDDAIHQIIAETLANIMPTLSHIQNQIADLTATQTPDLMAQLNASLTQFYKFCQTIAERMDRLESELGIEHVEHMELDLETLQVSQTQSYAYADLEFVRNSVSHGKPDKEAVRQWLVNERQINPAQSYATLAENLNQAGIPTLSGRDTWNRGTLRNLITER